MANPALQLDLFEARLPKRPYHAPESIQETGLRIAYAQQAIKSRYIQHNGPTHKFWLVFDIDRPGAGLHWSDVNAPPPNIAVMNPDNRKSHYLYSLEVAVRTADDGSEKALRYAAAIEHALAVKLDADLGYAGLICKNPLNKHWDVAVWDDTSYTLDDLASWVTLDGYGTRKKRLPDYGLGRNCNLFDYLRNWSYKAIRQGWPDYEQWFSACLDRAKGYNLQQFGKDMRLPESEVKATAKSVAKFTYKHFSQKGFSEWQSERGSRKGQALRDSLIPVLEQMLLEGTNKAKIARELGVTRQTLDNWLKRTYGVACSKKCKKAISDNRQTQCVARG